MARRSFKAGALTAPVPPVLVTVGDMKEANIITIGWTGILSTHPPRTYISVRPERFSHSILKSRREFVINLARASMAREVDFVGIYTGAKVDKFERCGFTKTASTEVAAPTISECPVALECRVVEIIPMGTHDVFIADIVGVSCDESILDEKGRICFDRAGLLAYAHGEYFALGEKLGSFGFSAKRSGNPQQQGRSVTKTSAESGAASAKPPKRSVTKEGKTVSDSGNKPFYLGVIGKKGAHRGTAQRKNGRGKR